MERENQEDQEQSGGNSGEQNQNQGQENSNQGTNSAVANPPAPPKDDPRLSLYEQMLRESTQRENETRRQLQEVQNKQKELEAPKPAPLEAADILNNPERFMERIEGAINKAVDPLRKFQQKFESQSEFDNAKNRLKSDPKFAPHMAELDPYIEQARNNMEPTDSNMRALVSSLVGSKAMGLLPGISSSAPASPPPPPSDNNQGGNQNQGNNNQQGNMSGMPAHLRPSAPNMPSGNRSNNSGGDTPEKILGRPMTESEKRMARYYNQTDVEYAQFMMLPAGEVPTTRLGLPEKK